MVKKSVESCIIGEEKKQGEQRMRYVKIIMGNLLMTSAYAFLTVPQKIVNGGGDQFFYDRGPAYWLGYCGDS